jgi:pimeloyl-ACP methyl ester carboxylesterase
LTGTGSGYRERWLTAQDGLKLFFRDYQPPPGVTLATPVLCLPGVSRNSKDFARLAERLSKGRRVICPDYRGRGRSQYDSDWRHYHPPVYVDDIRHLLTALGVHRVHVIGTSLGGILAMVMAVAMPGAVASVVLNDIGAEVDMSGLARIIDYLKDDTPLPDWDAVVERIRETFPDLPARSPEDWLTIARNTYKDKPGRGLVHDWDHAIVNQFAKALGGKISLWPLFKALENVPVLTVRGAKSNILSDKTLRRMADAMPSMAQVTVEDCGHPPSLSEANVLEAIDAHLAPV